MNKLIRELAEKARNNEYGEFDTEKFAELIILECASLFPRTFTDERYQRRIDSTIRKHFGIEG